MGSTPAAFRGTSPFGVSASAVGSGAPAWAVGAAAKSSQVTPLRVAFLARTSTEDQQDPTISIPRQLRSCENVLSENAVIVAHYYDVESGRKDIAARGRGSGHTRFAIPVPRDGGIADLLARAESGEAEFDAVICESIDRVARRTYYGTLIEYRLERAGISLLAADEPIVLTGGRKGKSATQTLTRRVKQGVAEWYVLDMLEKSWGGFEQHTEQGFNIGQPPYGYYANKIPHPVPARRHEGRTKHRLTPDPVRAPVVELIFHLRVFDRLALAVIAEQLNRDLVLNPPPVPPDPSRAVGAWNYSSVRSVLCNPKYTGHMVWNRRAMKSGNGKCNPIEEWVWSPEPTHEAIISPEMFVQAQEITKQRPTARTGTGAQTVLGRAARIYPLRSHVFCVECGRRMFGQSKRDVVYYSCMPKAGHTPDDHPRSLQIREDTLNTAVADFFRTQVFGAARTTFTSIARKTIASRAAEETRNRIRALNAKIADADKRRTKIIHSIEVAADLNADFVHVLQERIRQIRAERETLAGELCEAESLRKDQEDPQLLNVPRIEDVNITELPAELQRDLYKRFCLEVRYARPKQSIEIKATLGAG